MDIDSEFHQLQLSYFSCNRNEFSTGGSVIELPFKRDITHLDRDCPHFGPLFKYNRNLKN